VILVGRNRAVAWGATYASADAIDSWVEDCRDGCFRRGIDGKERWEPFDVREEVIERRRGDPLRLSFHDNLHGTLDGDPNVPGRYLATRWAGRDCGAKSLAAALELHRAGSARQAGDLLSRVEWPFSWAIADREGSIVFRMSGQLPRRRDGVSGLLPLAGWRAEDDWLGFHDPDELPQRADPPQGYLVTANDDLNRFGIAHPINAPCVPYRADRIAEVLGSRRDWSADDLGRLQMDVLSLQAKRFMAVLRPLLAGDERFTEIFSWDGSYEKHRAAAWFEAFYGAATEEVLSWACGPEVARYVMSETDLLGFLFGLIDDALLKRKRQLGGRSRTGRRAEASRNRSARHRRPSHDASEHDDAPHRARCAPSHLARIRPRTDPATWRTSDRSPDPAHPVGRARYHGRAVVQACHRPRPGRDLERAARRTIGPAILAVVQERIERLARGPAQSGKTEPPGTQTTSGAESA